MSSLLRSFLMPAGLVAGLSAAPAAYADTVVNVTLIDKAGTVDLGSPEKLGMGLHGNMKDAKMGINVSARSIPRGAVTFKVTNLASVMMHEVILTKIDSPSEVLTYDEAKAKVDQETKQTIGQVSEIYPSKTAAFTVDLKPGAYLLYCNYPGHYMAGMWTTVEVK